MFGRQIRIAAVQHNGVIVIVRIDMPRWDNHTRIVCLISSTTHRIILIVRYLYADFSQLLLITNQDIGFSAEFFNDLSRKIASVRLAINRVRLYRGIRTELRRKYIAVI